MSEYLLLKSQMSDVFLLIKAAGLSPIEFAWKEEEHEREDEHGVSTTVHLHRLVHNLSGYSLLFGESSLSYTPGSETQGSVVGRTNWAGKKEAVGKWLTYLKREIDTPDLWASLAQEQELFGAEPSGAVNAPFNAEEQAQIKRAINEIRVYITSTYSLAAEPLGKVNARLDYLIDASTRLGRIDWKNILAGAFVGLVVQQLIPSGSGFQELIGIAGHLLRHVLSGVMSSPPLH